MSPAAAASPAVHTAVPAPEPQEPAEPTSGSEPGEGGSSRASSKEDAGAEEEQQGGRAASPAAPEQREAEAELPEDPGREAEGVRPVGSDGSDAPVCGLPVPALIPFGSRDQDDDSYSGFEESDAFDTPR